MARSVPASDFERLRGVKTLAVLPLLLFGVVGAVQFGANPIEVERVFKSDFGSIELVGVCKATESTVNCWTPERKPFLDMETKVKKALGSRMMDVQFCKKNRLAIFRMKLPPMNAQQPVRLWEGMSGNAFAISSNGGDYNKPRDFITGVEIHAEPAALTGHVSTTITRSAPISDGLRLEAGQELVYQGFVYKVIQIVKSNLDPVVYGIANPRWTIVMSAVKKGEVDPAPYAAGNWYAIDRDGLMVRGVDPEGKPVFVDGDELQRIAMFHGSGQLKPGPDPRLFEAKVTPSSQGYYGPRVGDQYALVTNIDPKYITSLRAQGGTWQTLTINGIPLDPK